MSSKYQKYLLSIEWANIRLDLFATRGKRCEICQKTTNLQVHHKTYERLFNEEPRDLIILCGKCHKKIHGIKNSDNRKRGKNKSTLSLAQKVIQLKKKRIKRKKWHQGI